MYKSTKRLETMAYPVPRLVTVYTAVERDMEVICLRGDNLY